MKLNFTHFRKLGSNESKRWFVENNYKSLNPYNKNNVFFSVIIHLNIDLKVWDIDRKLIDLAVVNRTTAVELHWWQSLWMKSELHS